ISKRGFIDAFPNRFATPALIAAALASEEFSGRYARDPEYFAHYRDRVAAVTTADVQRVARRVITPENWCVLLVGNKRDILRGDQAASSARIAGIVRWQLTHSNVQNSTRTTWPRRSASVSGRVLNHRALRIDGARGSGGVDACGTAAAAFVATLTVSTIATT